MIPAFPMTNYPHYMKSSRYVALLRGINVGGKAPVAMSRLKACFETAGCTQVSTYINSGNVLFSDHRPAAQLVECIEVAIAQEFHLGVPVVIRDAANLALLCQKIPLEWTNDALQKTDVLFLWDEVDRPSVLDMVAVNPGIEHALYLPGALVWNIGRENVTRGGGVKLIKTDLYKHVTVRNINTVRKLNTLLTAAT